MTAHDRASIARAQTAMARLLLFGAACTVVARCVSFDEVPDSEFLDALLARAFPLARDAVSWESVNWINYSKIIISGPQRSGTTFFAASLAAYLGYTHVDEGRKIEVQPKDGKEFFVINGAHDTPAIMSKILDIPERLVLQRPTWSAKLHELPLSPDIFVAFIARNCLDVYRSQNRIMTNTTAPPGAPDEDTGWTCKFGRKREWRRYHEDPTLLAVIDSEHDMICTMKQQAYQRYQRHVMDTRGIANAPIAYASFGSLPAFVNSTSRERHNLGPKQIATRRRRRRTAL
jgi:hypothetical protein